MKLLMLTAFIALTSGAVLAQTSDYEGFKDPALFTRLPNYCLCGGGSFEEKQFDAFDFRVSKDRNERVEGHSLKYNYTFEESKGAPASSLQVVRNYQNAAKRVGGKILFENDEVTTLRVSKDGKETWVAVSPSPYTAQYYTLLIIERQAMTQDVVADAAVFQAGLKENGHVEVPGIFFDFGKSELKPESGAALSEVVKLLQGNPALKVWVVGHTDNVGLVESNRTLSDARAAAVVKALAQKGIEANRLAPHGAGPYAPVASNATDAGRARNRRVELVAQP